MATSPRLDELKKKFDENPRRYFAPLANEYRKLGDLTQAIALCRAHLPNQPGHISGHIVLAQALCEARELGESRQIFEAALDLDPENLIALRYLGDIAREQDEPSIARTWYERVLDADPRNDEIAGLLKELDGAVGAPSSTVEFTSASTPPYGAAVASTESSFAVPSNATLGVDQAQRAPWERNETSRDDASVYEFPAADQIAASFSAETDSAPQSESPIDSVNDSPFVAHFVAETFVQTPMSDSSGDLDFFAGAPSESSIDSSNDPFASPAATVPRSAAFGELEAVAEPSIDDWFSAAGSTVESANAEPRPSSTNEGLRDDFFPDPSAATPATLPAISLGDAGFAAFPSLDLGADSVSPSSDITSDLVAPGTLSPNVLSDLQTISPDAPTPPFVNAIAESSEPVSTFSFESSLANFTHPFPEQVASVEQTNDGSAGPPIESTIDKPITEADGQTTTPSDTESSNVPTEAPPYVGTAVQSEFEKWFASPLVPVAERSEGTGDARMLAPTVESATPTSFEAISSLATPTEWPEDAASLTPESTPTVSLAAEDALSQTVSLSAEDALSQTVSLSAEGAPSATLDEFATPVFVASVGERSDESSSLDEEATDSVDSTLQPTKDFVVEHGEFVPPLSDDVPPFIARPHSLTPEGSGVHEVGAPELLAGVTGDALIGRIPALANAAQEETPIAFVTETMAELYLQQGFQHEALSIYRQLLALQPNDATLRGRVAELEQGVSRAAGNSIGTAVKTDRLNHSVRAFFSHFARREPRRRSVQSEGHADAEVSEPVPAQPLADDRFSGAATRAEALTVPDDGSSIATLSQLFSTASVSGRDDAAAESLAAAFGGIAAGATFSGRSGEKELSLEHLFRDVPSRSSGAVTLDEFCAASPDAQSDAASARPEDSEERDADIEQFTAWLEGLKKK